MVQTTKSDGKKGCTFSWKKNTALKISHFIITNEWLAHKKYKITRLLLPCVFMVEATSFFLPSVASQGQGRQMRRQVTMTKIMIYFWDVMVRLADWRELTRRFLHYFLSFKAWTQKISFRYCSGKQTLNKPIKTHFTHLWSKLFAKYGFLLT